MLFYQNKDFLNKFVQLIKECNKIVLDIYNTDFKVDYKSDDSPLTIADKKCNDYICNFLNINFPNILIISEENKEIEYNKREKYEYCWLIDPIDGTKEFIKKNGQFTINIGLCKNSVPIFGIVSIPVTDEIYYGINGIGSFKIHKDIKKELSIEKKNYSKEGVKIIASSSHLNNDTKNFINQFNNPEILNTGSSIKLLYIAEEKADIYPRLAPTSEWDTCAAHAVVKYAGGNVLKYNSDINFNEFIKNKLNEKEELLYNKENILNPYFIVL